MRLMQTNAGFDRRLVVVGACWSFAAVVVVSFRFVSGRLSLYAGVSRLVPEDVSSLARARKADESLPDDSDRLFAVFEFVRKWKSASCCSLALEC